jgi:hypothetical protein
MTFQTKLLIIHADKVSAENKNFFLTKAWVFTRAYCFETQKKKQKVTLSCTFTRPNHPFPKD